MSATNATTNYSFPLFIGTDKPAWLVDWNSAMSAIDAAIKGVDTDVQGAIVDISGLSSTVAAHTSSISTISGQITVITTNLNTATGNINTINSLIGNGTPTTTDQTLIGAINELHANQGDLADLTTPAVSLVAAINAITGGGGAVAASAVSYDNTTSGLSAANVQAAIDELHSSTNIAYDNTVSGLTATNVKAAIDELAQGGGAGTSFTVTADGTKTGAQLLSELDALVGSTPISEKAYIVYRKATGFSVYKLDDNEGTSIRFSKTYVASAAALINTIDIKLHNMYAVQFSTTPTYSDGSSSIPASGTTITLYV